MFKSRFILSIAVATFFVGCTVKEEVIKYDNKKVQASSELKKEVKQTVEVTKPLVVKKEYKVNQNEKDFLDILENDSYSSLCGSKNKYEEIKVLENSEEKTNLISELFVTYVENLANSCIDVKDFQKKLSAKKYDEMNQDYEVYLTDIKKDEILNKFNSSEISVKEILDLYAPKHPNFFKFIEALDKNSLTTNEYKKLKLNIERFKLLKYQGSDNFIQLNVPSTDFTFYEDGKVIKNFRTVVGEKESQTPVLSSNFNYFVINPTWNIPDSIAKKSIIPKALKDKNYLKSKNIVIRKNYNLDSQKIKFSDVNWKKYLKKDVKYIPYKFIQLPSTRNGMGRLKFLFKNKYAVYMHDTIGSWRFKHKNQNLRFASHGCIRLEHPLGLMQYITTNYTKHNYSYTKGLYDSFKTSGISLSKKLPIHLTYITSYINNDGKVSFYKDRYDYDKIQKLNYNL